MSGTGLPTVLLDPLAWDLCLDASGNLAMASPPYSQAQDAASAIRLFAGELYYDVSQGIPFWSEILGRLPAIALMKAKFEASALTVPGVVSATCYISSVADRVVSGQVQIVNDAGQTAVAGF
jgi:hypothetical protein